MRALASTGISGLDQALDGLFWGDNVVWEVEAGGDVAPFVAAVTAPDAGYERVARVVLEGPDEPELDRIDGREGSDLAQPVVLSDAIAEWCSRSPRSLVVLDSLDHLLSRWGSKATIAFFQRTCPLLLRLGAVAYWSVTREWRSRELRRAMAEITQCILVLEAARVRVAKADARPPGAVGRVLNLKLEPGRAPELTAAPAATRLAAALRRVREERNLSQAALARMADISPSAVSQAERGHRGLSLDTVVTLAGTLHVTLDDLLGNAPLPGYRLSRRDHPQGDGTGTILPLVDDPRAGLRVYAVTLPRGTAASPDRPHKGAESTCVAAGLVQVVVGDERAVLREGEALVAGTATIKGWRNLGDQPATAFWVLRDG